MHLTIRVLPGEIAVCRLPREAEIPAWAWEGEVCGALRAVGETSVVTAARAAPAGVRAEKGWRALKVAGPLDFSLTGIMAALAGALAAANVSIFALSTFDTDYLLVKQEKLLEATIALEQAGHTVELG